MLSIDEINQPYSDPQKQIAYNKLKSYYPNSAVKTLSMEDWFKQIKESQKLGHLTSGQELFLGIYKLELERQIK